MRAIVSKGDNMNPQEICKHYIYYTKDYQVCVNDESDHCADFVTEDESYEYCDKEIK